jgi:hypothetical protein
MLKSNFICLREEEEDSLCWARNPFNGNFSVKMGYLSLPENPGGDPKRWWWENIWKQHAPLKVKLTFWLALN